MKLKYILPLFAASAMLTACDSILDTVPEGGTVVESQISDDNVDVLAIGLYQELIDGQNTFGSQEHTDYGIPAMHMRLENDGMDMVADNSGYNHYNSSLTYTDRLYNSTGTLFIWYRNYKIIKACNELLKIINPNTEDKELISFMAEARALRAYAYFSLAQVYQFTYFGNEDKACVPIKTEKMTLEEGNNNPRASVKAVYELIMSDLNYAVEAFEKAGMPRRDKMTVNADVARGIRARVNLVMHNYQAALDDAEKLEAKYQPYSRDELKRPTFVTSSDPSWIWGLIYNDNSTTVMTGIANWPSFMCSFVTNGYTTGGSVYRKISKKLFEQISASDVRYGWWLDENQTSPILSQEYLDFVEEKGIPAYANVKFGPADYNLNAQLNTQHYPMMRVEEMILIKAECMAHVGNLDAAKEYLANFVKNYRDNNYICDAKTETELVDEIWKQRRIELWGEGFAFYDIMRLGKDIDRSNSNYEVDYSWKVKAGDPILLYRIPKDEIEANNGISDKDNNPATDLPTVK